ncbi:MAG: PorT family protein [Bacteroidetes bacterium]|nr:MAG: PorT family protein [Bacteroidota bacterium]TAE70256.1 MAG: PorT family protein [Bacteroidota bacterium]
MKKLLLGLLVLVGANSVMAQAFRLGIKGGANFTKIGGESFSNDFNFGYHLGGFAEIDFNKSIGIQPEVLFNQSNTQTSANFNNIYIGIGGTASQGEQVRLDYLSIPVLLRINASKMVTLLVGPQYSILINHKENLFTNGREAFKNGDFALATGLQLNLQSFRVYGRYNIGLSNMNDIDNKDRWRNQQLQLGIGIKL